MFVANGRRFVANFKRNAFSTEDLGRRRPFRTDDARLTWY
jgi:hypothetical protein